MDNWQKEVAEKLIAFVNDYPPSLALTKEEVRLSINIREAYVLLNIINEWTRFLNPLLKIDAPTESLQQLAEEVKKRMNEKFAVVDN